MAYRQEPAVDVLEGALFGAGAFVVGVLLTFMGELVGTVSAAGNVADPPAEGSAALTDQGGLSGVLLSHVRVHDLGLITGSSLELGLLPHAIIVVAILVVTGYVVAASAGNRWASGGFKHGASIATGYFALTLLSMAVIVVQVEGLGVVDIETVLALLVVGLVYPLVFGGVGGAIANAN